MRAAFVIATLAAVILPIGATPIPGQLTSKGNIRLPMNSLRLVVSDDSSGSKPFHDAYQLYQQEVHRRNSTTAAASDHQSTEATEAELDALVGIMQAPSPTFDITVGERRIHDVGEILGAMQAGKTLAEIKQAFHSKDGKPIYLTGDEVDSAIGAYFNNAISDEGAPLDGIQYWPQS